MNIVVLCGGVSSEREVSLKTSTKVSKALRSCGHQVVMIDVFFGADTLPEFQKEHNYDKIADDLRAKTPLITKELIEKTGLFGPNVLEVCRKADCVFIGLHGANGEDGKVQAAFDAEGIRYTGSGAQSSAIAMSKERTKEIVSPHIRMPKGIVAHKGEPLTQQVPVPCVMKPSNGGSSLGVIIVRAADAISTSLEECFRFDDTVLIEEYIEGRELTMGVLNGKALPPVEICSEAGEWYDYQNKYNGKTKEICPAQIPSEVLKEMSQSSLRFGELLGLSVYYRIDFLLDREGKLYALEANTLPGMTDTSLVPQEAAASGMSYPQLCEEIIRLSMQKYM